MMNSEAPRSTDHRKFNIPVLASCIAIAALLLMLAMLWRNLSSTNAKITTLAEENSRLRTELMNTRNELDFFKTGDSSTPAKQTKARPAPVRPEPVEELETLVLQPPTVSQIHAGLAVRLEFKPVGAELPKQITVVVRVPGDSASRILSLKPISEAGYANVESIVDPKGRLGMVEGSPVELETLVFELSVSDGVTATVRGSEGIKDFEIDIASDGCIVRKL